MSAVRLVAVDWGTTAMRCYLVACNGEIIARTDSADGILTVADGEFAEVLVRAVEGLGAAASDAPILMSGMIGSRQGWFETPYVRCPANLLDLAARLQELDTPLAGAVHLVPGLDVVSPDGVPDVMRGEETQVFGALASLGRADGRFVLPGTHAKWVSVKDGRIDGFATFMTGEVFAALKNHTILGRLMTGVGDGADDPAAFARGVAASSDTGGPGLLLHQIFSARTLGLAGNLEAHAVAPYLSGLLIGSEILAAAGNNHDQPLSIIAGSTLAVLYAKAASITGHEAELVDGDCVVRGHLAIADVAGI